MTRDADSGSGVGTCVAASDRQVNGTRFRPRLRCRCTGWYDFCCVGIIIAMGQRNNSINKNILLVGCVGGGHRAGEQHGRKVLLVGYVGGGHRRQEKQHE